MHHVADALHFVAHARRSQEWPEILYVSYVSKVGTNWTQQTNGDGRWTPLGLLKKWIAALTDIGLMLLALAIVASLLSRRALPFSFGGVVGNIVSMVKDLGSNGLVGLITVGIIMWLFLEAVARLSA